MAVQEYKRKCNACGKVWHSLASREAQLVSTANANNAQLVAGCCNPGTASQAMGTQTVIGSELTRLRTCPECGSASYTEELISYDAPDAG